ncbi:hypothetical protein JCM10450v2_006268 [Rhodotorula kratochvilovae]
MQDVALMQTVVALPFEPHQDEVAESVELPVVEGFTSPLAVAEAGPVFKEVLDEPIPTYDELERFGLFDHATCARLLAEYRLAHPVPLSPPPPASIPLSPASDADAAPSPAPRRPSEPQHRHSVAVVPLAPETVYSPLASPSIVPRLNPFNLVRKTTLRPRPSQRAKSTSDVPLAPTASTSTFPIEQPAEEKAKARPLSRQETVKENRAPRKLRKQAPPKITLRTDDEYLLRPFAEAANADARPDLTVSLPASGSPRPAPARRLSWRSGLSSFVSSPLAGDFDDDDVVMVRGPRSPSPVSAFPANVRRESLPPLERKKRDSTMSSTDSVYLADSERTRLSPRTARSANRFSMSAAPPSPTGSTSSSSVWSRALKLGAAAGKGRRSGSRPASVASLDSPVAPSDEARSFEVLGRRPSPRPTVERSVSEDVVPGSSGTLAEQAGMPASASSPNLSRIVEQPETPDMRASVVSTGSTRRLAHVGSLESLPPRSGVTTPAVLSTSSSFTAREGSSTPVRPSLPRSRCSSNLALTSATSFGSLAAEYARAPASAPASQPSFPSTSSLSLDESWQSSYSHSQDSLFYSGDDTPASSASVDVEDELTGASSAQDDEDDDAAEAERRRRAARKEPPLAVAVPLVVDQGRFVSSSISQSL